MLTGSNGVDEIGFLRLINNAAYANKVMEIFNGNELVEVTQQDPKFSIDQQELNSVSAGMQFPPDI